MAERNYLPRKDRDFLSWIINFLGYLASILPRIGFPESVYTELVALRDAFAQKLSIAETPATRTKLTVQAKKTARTALEKRIRLVVKEYVNFNHMVTDEDRDGLGLPIYKTGRTPVPVPTQLVDFILKQAPGSRVEVHFSPHSVEKEFNEKSAAKPYGVRGVELGWAVLGEAPKSYADLVHSVFDTHSPYVFQFDLSDAGKTLYVCARWENTTGEKGPWSNIQSAIIP